MSTNLSTDTSRSLEVRRSRDLAVPEDELAADRAGFRYLDRKGRRPVPLREDFEGSREDPLVSLCARRRGRLWLVRGSEFGLHLFDGLGKFLGMEGDVEEKTTEVEGRSGKLAKGGGEWRAARAAGGRDVLRKLDGVHASTGQRLMWILHQPDAVVAVHNHVGRNDHPLTLIRRRGALAIPDLRLRYDQGGIAKAPLIQVNFFHCVLIGKPFHLREGLIPIEVGIIHQGIGRTAETEGTDVREEVRIGMHRREQATHSQRGCGYPRKPP
jgi:hypothetical protein